MTTTTENTRKEIPKELRFVDKIATIMDNAIPIPFTNRRFGVDAIVGLIPNVGDLLSLAVSSLLLIAMAKHGVSFFTFLKMIGNIILDATVGSVPIIGDWFDFTFKANRRNVALLKQDYAKEGSKMNFFVALFILLVVTVILAIILIYYTAKLISYLWHIIAQQF